MADVMVPPEPDYRECQILKMRLQMSEDFVDKLRRQLQESEEQLQVARRTYYSVVIDKEGVLLELSSQKKKCEQLLLEKTDLMSLLATRNDELSAMDQQLGELRDRLTNITEKNVDSDLKVEIVSLRETSLNQREARLTQEMEIKNRRVAHLESELERVTNELITAKREQTTMATDLEAKLEHKNDQIKRLKEELIHVKNGCDAKDNHMSLLNAKIRKQQEVGEKLQKQYSSQTQSLQEMLNIESNAVQHEKKQNEKLVNAIKELQELLKCSKESHSQMERQLVEKSTEYENAIHTKDFAIRRLEREIDALKDKLRIDPREQLEQELEVFYPAASRASRALRDQSMSTSFSANVSYGHIDELNRLREENARLIAEAEENAPLTLAKMLEHKKAVEMITQLQNKLTQVMTERNDWNGEKETLMQLSKEQERRLRRFEQENEDLSVQVRTLLHALDDSNGPSLVRQIDNYTRRSSGSTTANDVVTAHLVTFESIEELQTRNRQLLAALRELSQDRESSESMAVAIPGHDASGDQLHKALREIESLRIEHKKQTEVIEAVVKQRDALQSIAAAFTPLESFYRIPPQTNVPDPNIEYLKQKLEEKEKELSHVRQQLQDQTKDANDEMNKLKDELMNIKIEERNISSRLETTQSNLESARVIVEENKTELQTLRDRIVSEHKELKKNEQELRKTKNEFVALNEKIRKNEDLIKHLTQERDMFKSSEASLRVEIDALRRERQTSHSIGETTKTLQAYIARVEADASRAKIAEALVEKLERENAQLKNRLAKQSKDAAEADENSSRRVEELKKSFSNEQTEEIERLRQQINTLRSENQELKKNILATKSSLESGASKRMNELEEKLNEKNKEVLKYEADVQRLNNEILNLRKLCNDKEEKFKRVMAQLNQVNIERKAAAEATPVVDQSAEMQSKLDSLQEKLKESMNQTKVALASNQEKDEKLKKVAGQARQRIAALQEQIKSLQEQNQSFQVQMQELTVSSAKNEQDAAHIQQLESKITSLEQDNEELLRFRLLNANLEAKLKQIEKENHELNSQKNLLEEKLRDQPESSQDPIPQQPVVVTTAVTFVNPNNSSVQAPPTQPVRPLPQQQPQPTKTATINPLPHPRPSTSTIAHVIPTQQAAQQSVSDEGADVQESENDVNESVAEEETDAPNEDAVVQEASVPEEQEHQEMVVDDEVPHEVSAPDSPSQSSQSQHGESSNKRSHPESPDTDTENSKRPKTQESSSAVDDPDTVTRTSVVESSDTNEDSSDRRPPPRRANVVVDDVIVIDDNSDEEESNEDGNDDGDDDDVDDEEDGDDDEDGSGTEQESESGNESSGGSDGRYSQSEDGEAEAEAEVGEEGAEQDDDGENDDQEEAVIVIGESNESQNDSHLSGEQVVQDEEVEHVDADASVESNSQPENSSSFNESRSSQVFAVPEEQRVVTRPTYLGQAGPSYEDSDSIVPSTPTLVVPRRGDGPELLNSPRVPQNSFQFASVSREGSPGLPLEGDNNRLDDTRIDLSQFNEGSSRQQSETFAQSSQDTSQLIVPDESAASMSGESVTPEPPNENASTQEETSEQNEGQSSQSNESRSQPPRQPIVWNAPTSIVPVRAPGPDQPSQIQPPVPGPSRPQVRQRRLQLRGARAFQQTARRAGGWRGGRGRGGGATQ